GGDAATAATGGVVGGMFASVVVPADEDAVHPEGWIKAGHVGALGGFLFVKFMVFADVERFHMVVEERRDPPRIPFRLFAGARERSAVGKMNGAPGIAVTDHVTAVVLHRRHQIRHDERTSSGGDDSLFGSFASNTGSGEKEAGENADHSDGDKKLDECESPDASEAVDRFHDSGG